MALLYNTQNCHCEERSDEAILYFSSPLRLLRYARNDKRTFRNSAISRKWTKQHSKFIGRVIFANFLKIPLQKYKNIITETEKELYSLKKRNGEVVVKYLSENAPFGKNMPLFSGSISNGVNKKSNVIAEIVKSGKTFSIKYTYEGFSKIYLIRDNLFPSYDHLQYKLRRINSRNELTHKIIEGIIKHQEKFLITGRQIDLVSFSQVRITEWIRRMRNVECGLRNSAFRNPQSEICNSWISRLVNRLTIITPMGQEMMLKLFFPTQRMINKQLIKQLIDKEIGDVESGELGAPLTDNQIKIKLENTYGIKFSRHSIGLCRREMGIPVKKMRCAGYKYTSLSANFSRLYPLTQESVRVNAPANSGFATANIFIDKGQQI